MPQNRESVLSALDPLAPVYGRKPLAHSGHELYPNAVSEYQDQGPSPTVNPSVAGVALAYNVPWPVRKVRIDLTDVTVTVVEAGEVDYGSVLLATLPDRNLLILNAEFVGTINFGGDIADNDDGDWGIGTAAASANPITGAMQNIIPVQALDNIDISETLSVAASLQAALGTDATLAVPDGASNGVYLNADIDATQLAADGTLRFNGYLDLYVLDLGNRGS